MLKQTSVHRPAITSFFLPDFLTQSRTRGSSHAVEPGPIDRRLVGEDGLDLLEQCLALSKGCREQGRHLEQLRRLGEEGRVVDDGLAGVRAQRQQLQILMVDQQERVIVGGEQRTLCHSDISVRGVTEAMAPMAEEIPMERICL